MVNSVVLDQIETILCDWNQIRIKYIKASQMGGKIRKFYPFGRLESFLKIDRNPDQICQFVT